ncbi:MAG: hypothetical protein COA44_02200 [Arcobacter sp.]|nr:MAG: hypothetical protein COA44_02200 [Arcobacter sp.]
MKEYNYEQAARNHLPWEFMMRMFVYIFLSTPPALFFFWLAIMSKSIIALFLVFIVPTVFFLWERSIRKFRKDHSLSAYKNINKELQQFAANEKALREKKAYESTGTQRTEVNKTDISYWHKLKEKGAITAEEYEKKKQELLS